MTDEELAAIWARHIAIASTEAAAEAEGADLWEGGCSDCYGDSGPYTVYCKRHDAEAAIARSVADIPALLAEVDRLRALPAVLDDEADALREVERGSARQSAEGVMREAARLLRSTIDAEHPIDRRPGEN